MAGPRVGVVIPALNESATIEQVVRGVASHGLAIVVDDGSTDATGAIAAAAGANVVTLATNGGYDNALNQGFARAATLGCEYVVTVDADGQHNPGVIGTFTAALDAGADVAIGIRDRRARLAEVLFALVGRATWGIRDPLCGLKAYRLEVWRELGHFDSYASIGTELAIFAAARRKRITQIPILTRDRVDAARFGRTFAANLRILRALLIGLRRYATG